MTNKLLSWRNGKYIKVDGIFAEVISKKGNVYKLQQVSKSEPFYLVTDGNGTFSHGSTLKKANDDLTYKLTVNAEKEHFANLPIDTVLSFDECVKLYRALTGACQFGVDDFLSKFNIERKSYSVAEIIEKTKGQFGNTTLTKLFIRSKAK